MHKGTVGSEAIKSRQARYWLAVVSDENAAVLAKVEYPFYALTTLSRSAVGDLCVLYRSGKNAGFIGAFEFSGPCVEDPVRLGDHRTFRFKLPWRRVALSDDNPVEIGPLLNELDFVTNKNNYGMLLRNSFRLIPKKDYFTILSRIRKAANRIANTKRSSNRKV